MSGAILAIDTATPAVTAGVVDGADRRTVLAERVTVDPRAHAERITPNVLAALADAGRSMADLAAVVVGCGPGPFTGLRVGMASAAAFGHALSIPVYGVCSLDAIGVGTGGETLVVTDARRREVYWARYSDGFRVAGPGVCAPADVDPGPAQAVAGSPAHAALFGLPVLDVAHPTPAGLVAAVGDWIADPAPPVPLYLRRPDATMQSGAMRRSGGMGPDATMQSGAMHPADVDSGPLVTIGPLSDADATRCAELEARLFDADDPWPAAAFHRALGARHHLYVGARIDDKLVGYAGIARLGRRAPFEYEVHTIGVDTAYQGRGIGRRLLSRLLDFADGGVVHLEVRTDNVVAIALYRDMGFVEVGLRKRYYRASGADAYLMRREPA